MIAIGAAGHRFLAEHGKVAAGVRDALDGLAASFPGERLTILSTPKCVLTGNACRRLGVGGEVLCNVW